MLYGLCYIVRAHPVGISIDSGKSPKVLQVIYPRVFRHCPEGSTSDNRRYDTRVGEIDALCGVTNSKIGGARKHLLARPTVRITLAGLRMFDPKFIVRVQFKKVVGFCNI